MATPLLAADGSLIAASSAATDDPAETDSLDDPGEGLKKAIATPGPRYGLSLTLSVILEIVGASRWKIVWLPADCRRSV